MMKHVILYALLLGCYCCAIERERSDGPLNVRASVTMRESAAEITISAKCIDDGVELWTPKKDFIKINGIGYITDEEVVGFGNGVVPRVPCKIKLGDKFEKMLKVENYPKYKSYEIRIAAYGNESDCHLNKNPITIKIIKLK